MTADVDTGREEYLHLSAECAAQMKRAVPAENTLAELAELFRIFGDSTRVKILCLLAGAELCVCDIARLLGMTQSAISHQLRALRQSRLVKSRREGKTIFYFLADGHVGTILAQGMEHIGEGGFSNRP